ncbi:MAG: amino acid adenylation domain-containing protein, partial [Nostocales cyanobacterium]
HDVERTNEKFIPNPLDNGETKLYRTGDLVRYLADGNIEYIGRIDNQVKIRGFRIELGEIESLLSKFEGVKAACVIAREDIPGDKRLVGYVVLKEKVSITAGDLRAFLQGELPDYMIPGVIMMLDSLPLTPSGKVDRRALPTPDVSKELSGEYVAPRNPIEEILAVIWQQVLKIERVGIYDHFFEIGGHSLLATQIISRVRSSFQVELSLRSIFSHPTIAQLAANIQGLKQDGLDVVAPPILVREDNQNLPLSFAQQRLWFIDQLQPNSPLYNMPMGLRLQGNLVLAALEKSFLEIINRHEVLRTNFVADQGQAKQVIHSELNWKITVVDLRNLSNLEAETATQNLVYQQAIQPFNLASEALIRATLIVLSETEHLLLVCMHHIVSDGWSIGLLAEELAALYSAFVVGEISPLTPLPIQYADFAIWQRNWLQGDVLSRELSYWQKQLENAPALLSLPTDRPRPAVQTFAGGNVEFTISAKLTEKLTKLSQQQGVTLFMTLLTAFQTLLYRYTGQTDILVGSPIANRDRHEIEGLIGFFINTLVMRGNLAGNPQFQELLPQIREMAMAAYSHQNLPFEMLVETLQPERNLSYTPIFQVVFGLQNAPMSSTQWTGLNVNPEVIDSPTSKFDLSLLMENTGSELVGVWEYSTDLFDRSTIERMMGHFITLLTAIVEAPQTRINELPILTETEKQILLNSQNNIQEYAAKKCLHQLFAEQVEKTPDAVAVVFASEQLTYRELNNKANQVAHYLRSLGVGADVLVGISVERSVEMLVGILGILKAGGAYVPLDPDYPRDRLEYMLSDSQVSILLTQEKCLESLPPHSAQVICLDRDWENIATASQENPVINNTSANLAYVIYTSGSTGKPKGTLINHSHVVRLFAATDAWYKFNQDDVWTMFHSYAFDFSVWEIWGALLYGGKLVIVPYMVTRSPESFYELLSQERVTVLNQTPSAFRQLIQAEAATTAKTIHLRYVIFGGEALEIQSLQPWFERHGDQLPQLVNMYGITETTVHVTYRPLSKADLNSAASVIGCPIPDLQVYVLDENLQPVPVGITGEMYVGGDGVARGYLNRPDLTEQRFIPNPFREGTKLYRTGDLARYLANGELEYLGRIDNQVKIRGFRIELGEIEATLAAHPDIWETVVVVREDEPGNKRLVAYVVSNTGITPTSAELRQFLGEQLPSYMIPSVFVSLQSLPLTSNGKIDRRALPAPDSARPELENIFVAPRTSEEQILAAIWSRVLDVAQVGIHDNFFALGGDSIRSIQVLSQAREQGLNLTVKQLFQYQTIAELVQGLKAENQEISKLQLTQPFSLVAAADQQLLPDGLEDAYPLAMLQLGMIYHSEYNQESAVYHDIFSYHLRTTLNVPILEQAINDLINNHPVLRTSFDLSNFSVPLQFVHRKVTIKLAVEDWSHLSDTQQEAALDSWFEIEKKQHFDWSQAPLLRFFVHRRTAETFNITVSFHHAILDGWSVASLTTELFKRYLSLLGEKVEDVSPEFSVKYRDFIALEQQAISSLATQQYWQQKLADCNFTKLPRLTSGSDEIEIYPEIGIQQVRLNAQISAGLKQLAHTAAVPLKNVLLAAHLRVLNFLSGEADVVTGVVTNGRPEQNDGERILGLFLNTLPLRLQLSGGSWIDLVKQVFAQEQEILPHRRYPLSQIQNNLGNQSLFETAFNFTNFHVYEQVIGLDNLEILGGKFFDQTNITFLAQFSIEPGSSDIAVNLEYNPRELSPAQVEQISNYYHVVLTAMAQTPESSYHLTSLISEQEQKQLLGDWNNTEKAYSHGQCLHQIFEEQVTKTPDIIAVEFADQKLTYQQLNNRANQLANHLISLGVKADVVVGICVQRSLEMIVGILAILKAGGAYLPLDPEYPIERLQFMVEDANIPVLITQTSLKTQFNQYQGHTICVDTDLSVISQYSEENTNPQVKSENLG